VNSIAGEAPEELKEPLDAVRNALVREAIDFSEVAQRVAVVAGAPALPRPVLRPLQTRVLSVESEPEYAPSQRRRSALLVVVFLLVLAAGAVFHGRTYYQKKHAHPPQPGIPPGMMALGVARGPRMVTMQTHDGAVDPAELERFREAEKAQGNVVTDAGGGSFIVTPAPPVHPDEAEKK
jgi:hypothetical protein